MNPLIPIGSNLVEPCPKCRAKVNSKVDGQHHATFVCPVCNHTWDYHIMGDGKGSQFSAEELKALLEKNKHISVNKP
jgi:transposase-like protein